MVLEHWPVAGPVATDAFTTVGQWRSYGTAAHDGVVYGQRAHSMRELMALASRSVKPLAPALAIHPGEAPDLAALRAHGWSLLDPAVVSADPGRYRAVRAEWLPLLAAVEASAG